jgi:hypothetical protein
MYDEVAPLFGLKPSKQASDMGVMVCQRSRVPNDVLNQTMNMLRIAELQYGSYWEHKNEATKVGYIEYLLSAIIGLFHKNIINRPEQNLRGGVATQGQIEFPFVSLSFIIVLFIEVKKGMLVGDILLSQIAQVIAEADGNIPFPESIRFIMSYSCRYIQ